MFYICEYEFIKPDGKNTDYAFVEIDIYHWIPAGSDVENHRLTLLKNLKTGEYELHRVYKKTKTSKFGMGIMISHVPTGEVEIIFKNKNLNAIVAEVNGLWMKYHGKWSEQKNGSFGICEHKHPNISFMCRANEKIKINKW